MSKLKGSLITTVLGFLIIYSSLTVLRANLNIPVPDNLQISAWICFYTVIGLTVFVLIGLGVRSFLFEKQIITSKRHLLLFTISISIVVNYNTMGSHLKLFEGDILSDMFDMLYYLSVFSLVFLGIIYLLSKLNKEKVDEGMERKEENSLFNDDPLLTSEQDVLNRKEFANQLINTIAKSKGKLTVGIYGPWGSGKSSFFTMMKEQMPKGQLTIDFTPWYFGENSDGIIVEFLECFVEQIKKSNYYDTGLEKELREYSNFFKSIQLQPAGATLSIGHLINGFLPEVSDLNTVKKDIDEMLLNSDKKIVVFIDELDRLDQKEIITVFKLIRLVCDFPNVVYVLALDEEIVSLALGQVYWEEVSEEQAKLRGRNYLEKFIQVPIYLPKVNEVKLKKILIDGLEEILQKHNIKTDFIERINSVYPIIDITTFRTIRNIKRYLNLVQIFVPILKKEVFVDDLLYLLFIKISSSGLYEWIRMHPYILCQEDQEYFKDNDEINEFIKKYSEYRRVIEELFPAMSYAYDSSPIRKDKKEHLPNHQLRISNKMYFSKYFMYATPENQISQEELLAFYLLLSTDNEAAEKFDRLCALYPVEEILNKMGNDASTQSSETILQLLNLLKIKYINSNNPNFRRLIGEYTYKCYLVKRDAVFASSLFKEPYPLQLLIELRNTIDYYRNDTHAIEQIDQVVIGALRKLPLYHILNITPQNHHYIIIDYFVRKEENESLRRKKFTEYITHLPKFEEIVICLNDGKMDDIVFYQKLVENIESETIEKYISIFEQNQEISEHKELYKMIKKGMEQAIPYIISRLEEALEVSEKQGIKVVMNDSFEKQKHLFLGIGLASEEQQNVIEELLQKIDQHNKKF